MNRIKLIAAALLAVAPGVYAAETHTVSEYHEVRNVSGQRQGDRHPTREACVAAAEALGVAEGATRTSGEAWYNCYSVKSFKFTYRSGVTPLTAPLNPKAPTVSATMTRPQWDALAGAQSYALDSCRGATCTTLTRLACVRTNSYDHTLPTGATARYRVAGSRATDCSGLGTRTDYFLGTTVVQQTNRAPTISGTPATSVQYGQAYSFRPNAADPDGNPLTFSITNKPSWATFDPANGHIGGNPAATNVGTYSNIQVSVSDGALSASLPAFAIAVTVPPAGGGAVLSWTPPTQNTDGTALTNLAGYRIQYGATCATRTRVTEVTGGSTTRYSLTDLSPGTYCFAVRAYTSNGGESAESNQVTKTVQ